MAEPAIASPIDVCWSFPQLRAPLIERPQVLYMIETMFEAPADIVVLDGNRGVGKTVIATQFAASRPGETFCVFTRGLSAISRSLDYLLGDLADQIHWYLTGSRLPDTDSAKLFVRDSLLRLHRIAVKSGRAFYFVVDGLLELPPEHSDIVEALLADYLPTGLPTCRVLATGPPSNLPKSLASRLSIRSFPPPGFSPDEARQYLGDLISDPRILLDINKTFRGSPGKLASVRRLLTSGTSPELLKETVFTSLSDLYGLEWAATEGSDQVVLLSLGVIAHAIHDVRIRDIATVVDADAGTIESRLRQFQFISFASDGPVSFVSQSFKEFAAERLAHQKTDIINRILDRLFCNSPGADVAVHVPEYLEAAERPQDLVQYITPEYLSSVCGQLESLVPVRSAVEHAIRAARQVNSYGDLLKFCLNRSLLRSLNTSVVLGSEIAARLKLNDRATALALAHGATLREDRLQLLARVAKHDWKSKNEANSDLVAEIEQLAMTADFSQAPEHAAETAADLLFISPECALRVIEAAARAEDHPHGLDVALAHLSMLAASDVKRNTATRAINPDDIAAYINNPDVRRFARHACMLVRSFGVEELLRNCDTLVNTADALYLLENWTLNHPDDPHSWKVIQYGLDRMLKATDYTPSARGVRRLATPLPSLATSTPFECNNALKRVDAQLSVLQHRGPSVEYVRLGLLLSAAESRWDLTAATKRLEDLYYSVAGLDVNTQAECFAWFLGQLDDASPSDLRQVAAGVAAVTEGDLLSVVDRLLLGTADHYDAVRGPVRALSNRRPDLVKRIVARVNTRERRDALRREAVLQMVASDPFEAGRPAGVCDLIRDIEEPSTSERTLVEVLIEIADRPSPGELSDQWNAVLKKALGLKGAGLRFQACCLAYAVWSRQGANRDSELGPALRAALGAAFQQINSDWDKADLGFTGAEVLADHDRELARHLLGLSYELRTRSLLANEATAESYLSCVRLSVRAFAGLAKRKGPVDDQLHRLKGLIERLPSEAARAQMWCDAALWCFGTGCLELGSLIVNTEIRPLLKAIEDPSHFEYITAEVAPALFIAHRNTAVDQLRVLSNGARTEAFSNVCWFLLTKLPRSEPRDGSWDSSFKLRYQDVADILDCLEHVDRDYTFYAIVASVSRSMTSESGHGLISRDQRLEIARRIEALAKQKIPDPARITHEGYVIAVEGQLCRLRQAGIACWQALRDRAERIDNHADRCLVLAMLADAIPSKHSEMREQLLDGSRAAADQIPAVLERIGRLDTIANFCVRFAPTFARQCLQDGMRMAAGVPRDDVRETQLSMIDLAYRIDPEFAATLVPATDDDPARSSSRTDLRRQLELNDARRRLARGERVALSGTDGPWLQRLGEFSSMMLGGLHSGRVESLHWEDATSYVELASGQDLVESYPVLAWLIENSIHRHYQDEFGGGHLRDLFEAMAFCCDVAAQIISKVSGVQTTRTEGIANQTVRTDEITIRAGERDKAMAFIQRWLERQRPKRLKICDPYFSPCDLEMLRLVRRAVPDCHVDVITSEKKQLELGIGESLERAYKDHWRLCISDQDPPDTDITIVGTLKTKKLGVHDRWWVGGGSGLAFGGSLNSLGFGDTMRIAVMSETSAEELEREEIDPYLTWSRRVIDGQRVSYSKFAMP